METVETFTDVLDNQITVVKAIGFAHWASYLINGDASGFDISNTPDDPDAGSREQAAADAFVAWIGGSIVDVEGESFFDRPETGGLMGDCVVYVAHVYGTKGGV
jgi:hypothetical protein